MTNLINKERKREEEKKRNRTVPLKETPKAWKAVRCLFFFLRLFLFFAGGNMQEAGSKAARQSSAVRMKEPCILQIEGQSRHITANQKRSFSFRLVVQCVQCKKLGGGHLQG